MHWPPDLDWEIAVAAARSFVSLHAGRDVSDRVLRHLEQLEALIASGCPTATQTRSADTQSGPDLIGTTEAAQILGCSTAYIRRIAPSLDGRRIGNSWIYDRRTVQEYASSRNTYRRP